MRRPVSKLDVKSLAICVAIIAGIFLMEIVCAYAFVDDFSFQFDATAAEGDSADSGDEGEPGENEYAYLPVEFDENAVNGMIDPSEKTGTKKEYGTIAFKINPNPTFKNGTAKGELMIENHGDNQHLIKVRIQTLAETEDAEPEVIYESGYLAPDMHITSAALDVELAKGEYAALAIIAAYDLETLDQIGELEQEITIKVLK